MKHLIHLKPEDMLFVNSIENLLLNIIDLLAFDHIERSLINIKSFLTLKFSIILCLLIIN